MIKHILLGLFLPLLLLASAPNGVRAQEMGPYDVLLYEEDLMIPMRDGVQLATDIYRPTLEGVVVSGPLPILMTRTPYNKTSPSPTSAPWWFASHGYVVVVQDTRGRYNSEGVFSKYYEYDAYDGYDTIEWVAQLPYTMPQVGMWGGSYGAHTQADAAKLNPPSLSTITVRHGGTSNAWSQKVRSGGAFELGQQLGWAFSNLRGDAEDPMIRARLDLETATDWLSALPLRKGLNPLSVAPNFEDYVLSMMQDGDYEHWTGLGQNWEEYYEQTADIPMLHVGGWYDSYSGGTIDSYVALSKLKNSPMRLLVGPWDHGGQSRSSAGDVEFGNHSRIEQFNSEVLLAWFNHYLKGKPTPAADLPDIRLFVMGTGDGSVTEEGKLFHGGYWRDESEWPLAGTDFRTLYFQSGGSLSTEPPVEVESATTYQFDPRDPVPTIGGAFSGMLRRGPYDQREREDFYGSKPPYLPLAARRDVVVFQTEPLEEDLEVVGPITVRLYASSDAVDTDFTAKLIDVYPPSLDFPTGFAMNLTDGIIRARYRESRDYQVLMEPGTVYEFEITPFPIGNVFKAGHRIRVDISSSNFPRFDVNPNTGEPLGMDRRYVVAENSIQHSSAHPSHIIIPVVPSRRPSPDR